MSICGEGACGNHEFLKSVSKIWTYERSKEFASNRDEKYLLTRRLHNILLPVSCHPYRCSTYQLDSFKYANHIMFIAQVGSIIYILNNTF